MVECQCLCMWFGVFGLHVTFILPTERISSHLNPPISSNNLDLRYVTLKKNPSKKYKSNKCHVSHILLKFGGFKMGDSATIASMRILSPQIL